MSETKACPFCTIAEGSGAADPGIAYQDERWLVRSISSTPAVAGWLLLQARRHIGDAADPNSEVGAVHDRSWCLAEARGSGSFSACVPRRR